MMRQGHGQLHPTVILCKVTDMHLPVGLRGSGVSLARVMRSLIGQVKRVIWRLFSLKSESGLWYGGFHAPIFILPVAL